MYDAPEVPPAPPGQHLLLFVGADLRPEGELGAVLARAGWRCLWLAGAEAALRAGAHARFDAVVLQAEACGGPPARETASLRRTLGCPLIVAAVTEAPDTADAVDEILALEFGADAYLAGPLAPRRLRAHLQALLRRRADTAAGPAAPRRPLALGAWALDAEQLCLQSAHRQVPLTELQCQLLQRLAAEPGRVVPRAELMHALAHGRTLHTRSVDVYVARLRRRLREQRVDELAIEGVRGRGYTLGIADPALAGPSLLHWVARRDGGAARLPAMPAG